MPTKSKAKTTKKAPAKKAPAKKAPARRAPKAKVSADVRPARLPRCEPCQSTDCEHTASA